MKRLPVEQDLLLFYGRLFSCYSSVFLHLRSYWSGLLLFIVILLVFTLSRNQFCSQWHEFLWELWRLSCYDGFFRTYWWFIFYFLKILWQTSRVYHNETGSKSSVKHYYYYLSKMVKEFVLALFWFPFWIIHWNLSWYKLFSLLSVWKYLLLCFSYSFDSFKAWLHF